MAILLFKLLITPLFIGSATLAGRIGHAGRASLGARGQWACGGAAAHNRADLDYPGTRLRAGVCGPGGRRQPGRPGVDVRFLPGLQPCGAARRLEAQRGRRDHGLSCDDGDAERVCLGLVAGVWGPPGGHPCDGPDHPFATHNRPSGDTPGLGSAGPDQPGICRPGSAWRRRSWWP